MRFNSIEIKNYRQYKHLKFDFPQKGDCDLHIIIGQNGIGKTNILNAITWCLYGVEPHLGDASRSLPRVNLDSKKEALNNNLDIVNVEVEIFAEDSGRLITFKRTLPVSADTDFEYRDELIVTSSDSQNNTKIHQNDEANNFINRFMPEKIREYFYFDGEQLHNYFLADKNVNIRDSIHTISQVDVLTRIIERIGKIIIKKQREIGKRQPDIANINTEIDKVKSQIKSKENLIEELNKQINISDKIIKNNTEKLRGQDNLPNLEERYQKTKRKLQQLDEQKLLIQKDLKKFIRDYKIALAFYPHAKETLSIITKKEKDNTLPPNIDKKLLEDMLSKHKCFLCSRDLTPNDENKIQDMLNKIKVSSETSHLLLNIKSEVERIIEKAEKYPTEKKELLSRLKLNEEDVSELEKDIQSIENEISKFTDKELIKSWHIERSQNEKLFALNNQKLGAEKEQLEKLNVELNNLEKKLSLAIGKMKEFENLNKMISFAQRAKDIISLVENDMISEVKTKMEKMTSNYFDKLIWKENTYKYIQLDDTYHLDLIHNDGYSCVGSCSAAERSLLALSFTLALHEVSGFDSLLFIDTPVARVSDVNRTKFAKVLSDVSKNKQIIMTFSPDEYSEEIESIFKYKVSNKIELSTQNELYTISN